MDEPGQKLRKARERLGLRYRDVEEASQKIADRRTNDEFSIGLSRLSDIENKGTTPSLYRLYSLCAIYRLDFSEALCWYGINLADLPRDGGGNEIQKTYVIGLDANERTEVDFPQQDPMFDIRRTEFLSRSVQLWGKLPLTFLSSLDIRRQKYGFIGTEDWSMYPVLRPGSFVQIDTARRKIVNEGWHSEFDRPIYFLEHRSGYKCCWCTEVNEQLILQGHSASHVQPEIYKYPGEIDVLGQIVGVAMRFDLGKRRHTRS